MTVKIECVDCGHYVTSASDKMRSYMMVRHSKETGHKKFRKIEYITVATADYGFKVIE